MKTMKKIVAILAVALMLCSMLPLSVAADGNVADFDTLKTNTSYVTSTTTDGWKAVNAAILSGGSSDSNPKFTFIGSSESTRAICLNGKTSAVGTLTSPTLTGGISKLTFSYGLPFSSDKVGLAITVTSADGATVAETTITNTSAIQKKKYDFDWDLDTPITGDFTIVIKNTSPSNSSKNKDRTAIWNLAWVSAAVGCDHASLACDAKCPNCGEVKEHKFSNICVAECENGCGTANPAYVAGHDYSNAYDATCNVCGATREVTFPEADSTLTLPDATALGTGVDSNQYTTDKYYVTGTIVETYGDSWATYGNFYIEDAEGNRFLIYGISTHNEDGTDTRYDAMTVKPEIGVTITVYGVIGNYNGNAQMKSSWLISMEGGCAHEYEYECSTICKKCGHGEREAVCSSDADYLCQEGACNYCGEAIAALEHDFDDQWDPDCNYGCGYTREVEEKPDFATITFDDASKRTERTDDIQVWTENGITVTNNKDKSTSNIIESCNPVRFYKNSEIVIAYAGMTSIEFHCNTEEYATALATSIGDAATTDGKVVTVNLAEAADSYSVALTGGQVRMDSITVYGSAGGSEEPPVECEHSWNAATCTEPATCALCGAKEGEALGHKYVEDIIDATCTATGTKTYECSVCFDSYDESIPMKAHDYVEGFCSACGAEEPDGFILVTDVNDLKVGDTIIIVAADDNYAMGAQKTNNRGAVAITKADNVIVPVDGIQIITLEAGLVEGTFAFNTGDGYLYAASGSSNHLKTQTKLDENGSWLISIADGVVSIVAQGTNARNVMQYNPNNGNPLFACYGSASQKAVAIYKQAAEPACAHDYDNACDVDCNLCGETREVQHNVIHVDAVAPTCTAMGNVEYWYCDVCGMAWLDAECTTNTNLKAVKLPMTEHTYFDACSAICEVCGYEREVSHNVIHVEAADATCVANGNIEYWYCDACGMAWLDAECTKNTNIKAVKLPATGEHTYDDDYDADCNVCGDIREVPEEPVDIIYGDADGDGEITLTDASLLGQYLNGWDVTLDEVAADADGDGEITLTDASLLGQYLNGWDVVLGPANPPLFNDGELGEW